MKMIPFLIESENGHDTKEVPLNEIEGEVKKQLEEGKMVTIEKESGDTQVLTKPPETKEEEKDWRDVFGGGQTKTDTEAVEPETKTEPTEPPKKTEPEKPDSWKDAFGKPPEKKEEIKTATSTNKMKGG